MKNGKDVKNYTKHHSMGCLIRKQRYFYHAPQLTHEIIAQPTKTNMKPLQMNPFQTKIITDTMKELKERAAKRQKTTCGFVGHHFLSNHRNAMRNHHDDSRVSFCDYDTDDMSSCDSEEKSRKFDIMDELNAHPNAIQILATPGGLITHWNHAFTKITKPSTSLKKIPLTIFELVDPKCLSSLYSMLALSLHNIGIVEVETFTLDDEKDGRGAVGSAMTLPTWKELHKKCARSSPISHLSITLPCKLFQNCLTRYNITIVFMNDISSANTCFLGILTPRSNGKDGKDDDDSSFKSYDESTCNSVDATSDLVKKSNAQLMHREVATHSQQHSLPCGKILRVNDGLLCLILVGPNNNSVE